MAFLPALSAEELHRYHRVVTSSVEVRSRFDVLAWLQGDMQRYLPHDIMIAAWGNFQLGEIEHDIITPMAGVQLQNASPKPVTNFLSGLFSHWTGFHRKPLALNARESGFLSDDISLKNTMGEAFQRMRSAMVHGIVDARGNHDCLYVMLSTNETSGESSCGAMAVLLPYIDTALRQITHLPQHTSNRGMPIGTAENTPCQDHNLTVREAEVLRWVALGKTNPEIGSILEISSFTVKNHLQKLFRKLDVTNRAQAATKIMRQAHNVQT